MVAGRTRMLAILLGTALLIAGRAPTAALAGGPPAVHTAALGTGFAVQYARFYPRKDGYRDTNVVSGTTTVPATVTIRIYTSGGTRIKSFLLGPQEGAYSVVWNGRKKDGSLFPQGTYTIRQFLTAEGTSETAHHTVVLSHKKLYWSIGSQTRYADTGAFFTEGDGTVALLTDRAHGIRLFGGTIEGGYAAGRYTFTLPSAHVYASLRVSIYGSGNVNGDDHETHGQGYVGIRNFETGGLDAVREVGYVWAWYSNSVPGEDHVTSDRKVQAWAFAEKVEDALLKYTKMQLTYKYGRLDY
jgi:hypothetical protein